MKNRALFGVVFGPNAAAMRGDDGTADGKTESKAFGFGRVERLEDFFDIG